MHRGDVDTALHNAPSFTFHSKLQRKGSELRHLDNSWHTVVVFCLEWMRKRKEKSFLSIFKRVNWTWMERTQIPACISQNTSKSSCRRGCSSGRAFCVRFCDDELMTQFSSLSVRYQLQKHTTAILKVSCCLTEGLDIYTKAPVWHCKATWLSVMFLCNRCQDTTVSDLLPHLFEIFTCVLLLTPQHSSSALRRNTSVAIHGPRTMIHIFVTLLQAPQRASQSVQHSITLYN